METLDAIALAGAGILALGGVAAVFPGRLRAGLTAQILGIALLGGTGAAVLAGADPAGAEFRSGIAPALGLDSLSGFFLALLAVTAVPTLVFARGRLGSDGRARIVAALTAAFLLALVGVLAARDVTSFLASWELMTLAPAAAILVVRHDEHVRSAVQSYIAITHLGGAGVWIALLVLADRGALGDPAALAEQGAGMQALVAISALIGFGAKAGMIPLHSWLPRAHPVAPAHLSALMSGMMVKVALYGLIRVEFEWLGATPRWLGLALLACGLVSALGGVLWALVQPDLKRLLAYSSIENVGIVMLGLGASMLLDEAGEQAWAAIAFAAALLHIANHAVFKVLLFLAAGAVEQAVGDLRLDRLGGLLRRMPWTGGAALIGSLAIAGVPPLNGFASEWLTLQALVHVALDAPLGVAMAGAVGLAGLAATAALALLCFVKAAGLVWLGPPRRPECAAAVEAALELRAALVALAAMCVLMGLAPGLLVPALVDLAPGAGSLARHPGLVVPGAGSLPTLALGLALVVLVAALYRLRGRRHAAPAPSWACGQPLVPALSWTSAGFTKPLRLVLDVVLRPAREIEVVRAGGMVQRIRYSGEVPSLADRLHYEPALRIGLRGARLVRRLQTGNVRTYALYLLALVLGLLACVRAGVLG